MKDLHSGIPNAFLYKQKEYGVSTVNHSIGELGKTCEEAYYAKMLGNNQRHD